MRIWVIAAVLTVLAFGPAAAFEETRPLVSGRRAGEVVPEFYVRAVTGTLRNRSVCYVCRNGERPVAMVLLRRLEPDLEPLLREIDRIVDENRAVGLRSFGVLLSDEPARAVPQVQTFAFDHRIAIPMTVATQTAGDPACQNVHADAAVTVVLYRKRRVETTYSFRPGELDEPARRRVIESLRKLAGR